VNEAALKKDPNVTKGNKVKKLQNNESVKYQIHITEIISTLVKYG